MPFRIAALAVALALVQAQATPRWKVGVIAVAGGHRYSSADLAQLTGLTTGGPLDEQQLHETVTTLAKTGLFRSLGYHFTQHDLTLDVTFDIEEPAWDARVLFDNFVMIPDEELVAAVRQRVPTFDGTAPIMPGVPEFIRSAVQSVVADRGIGGTVEFRAGMQGPVKAAGVTYVFRLNAPGLQTCAARVDGASGPFEASARADVAGLVGKDFSRYELQQLMRQVVVRTYQPKGYWAAGFTPASIKTGSAAACFGISVSLTIVEGDTYVWDHAIWQGNTVLATDVLDRAVGMSTGDLADRSKLEDGLLRIAGMYRERGYLGQMQGVNASLDTRTHRAVVTIAIDEGPRYTMGTLTVTGASDATVEKVRSHWRLASGDPFDATYPNRFAQNELTALARSEKRAAKIEFTPDDSSHVVPVTITFR